MKRALLAVILVLGAMGAGSLLLDSTEWTVSVRRGDDSASAALRVGAPEAHAQSFEDGLQALRNQIRLVVGSDCSFLNPFFGLIADVGMISQCPGDS